MAQTTGSSSRGRRSRFTARTLPMICAHCQSKCQYVGNLLSACDLLSSGFLSIHNPNIRPQAGPINPFQKTGTLSSGGLVQSRSELRATNSTLPPAANFVSASSQELVTTTSEMLARDPSCGTPSFQLAGRVDPSTFWRAGNLASSAAGYTQKFHSFSKYVTPRTTPGPGIILRSVPKNVAGARVTIGLYSLTGVSFDRSTEILPSGMFFPIEIVLVSHSPCGSNSSPTIRQTPLAFTIGSAP